MPQYEFLCLSCRRRFTILCPISERDSEQKCTYCNSLETSRMISRFKTIRSEEQLIESLADPTKLSGLDENDPKSFTKWARNMAREMGENMDDEIEAMAEEEFSSEDTLDDTALDSDL